MTSDISIIIPTLNEAKRIPLLQQLLAQVDEVIVVDGGSSDRTVQLATDLGISVLTCNNGRGAQLNIGAAAANSSILLFLHVDTVLPEKFPELITACLQQHGTVAGAFSLGIHSHSFLLRMICMGANLRSRLLQLPYGDQSLFIRKADFATSGGFPEIPIMEDYIFVKMLQKKGKIVTLPQTVCTSARRWRKLGPIRTTLINQMMILGYRMGIAPEKLALFYRSGGIFRKLGRDKGTHPIS